MANKFDDDLFEDVAYQEPEDMQEDLFEEVEFGTEEPEVSKLEAVARGAAQGLTFDFADELAAYLAAKPGPGRLQELAQPIAKTLEQTKASEESYREELEKQREAFRQAREAHPVTYTGAEIGAGIAPALMTGGAALVGKMGQALGKEGLKQAAKESAKLGAK